VIPALTPGGWLLTPSLTVVSYHKVPQKPFIYQSRVRFGDTDVSGRIFYVSLLNHFDAAETEFLRDRGIFYSALQDQPVTFPRVRVECDYTSALAFDDLMDIAVTVDRIGGASFTLAFDVSVAGRNAARGKITIVSFDKQKQRACPLPEGLRAALQT
jgi:YbgC/YbaW family acyl-CoA thioester hydrolase